MQIKRRTLVNAAIAVCGVATLCIAWWAYLQILPSPAWLNAYHWRKASSYETWLQQGDHVAQVKAYEASLTTHGVANVLPMSELLSAARDWRGCASEPFVIPPPELHHRIAGTLQILAQLRASPDLLPSFSISSGYRPPALNRCAGGASQSSHLQNVALDLDLNLASPFDEERVIEKLCVFWKTRGLRLNMGLGVYGGGRIHIDAAGFRTWGTDYRKASSPCQRMR